MLSLVEVGGEDVVVVGEVVLSSAATAAAGTGVRGGGGDDGARRRRRMVVVVGLVGLCLVALATVEAGLAPEGRWRRGAGRGGGALALALEGMVVPTLTCDPEICPSRYQRPKQRRYRPVRRGRLRRWRQATREQAATTQEQATATQPIDPGRDAGEPGAAGATRKVGDVAPARDDDEKPWATRG